MNHSNSSSSNTNPPVKGLLLTPTILYVHESQKGNPVINHLKNVKWQYTSEIKADYLMNTTAALFLSVRYHNRHPKVKYEILDCMLNIYLCLLVYSSKDRGSREYVSNSYSSCPCRR